MPTLELPPPEHIGFSKNKTKPILSSPWAWCQLLVLSDIIETRQHSQGWDPPIPCPLGDVLSPGDASMAGVLVAAQEQLPGC